MNYEEILKNLKFDLKKDNGHKILLNTYEIEVLNKYNFDYKKYKTLNELIFDIDNYINEESCYNNLSDLEEVLDRLCETHYYNETKK